MRVSIQFDLDAARELHRSAERRAGKVGRGSSRARGVQQLARELGVTLSPVHPGQTDDLLAPFFYVEVPDGPTAEHVAKRFRQADGVEGAWVRPSDESV
jgi:hypothetical protein